MYLIVLIFIFMINKSEPVKKLHRKSCAMHTYSISNTKSCVIATSTSHTRQCAENPFQRDALNSINLWKPEWLAIREGFKTSRQSRLSGATNARGINPERSSRIIQRILAAFLRTPLLDTIRHRSPSGMFEGAPGATSINTNYETRRNKFIAAVSSKSLLRNNSRIFHRFYALCELSLSFSLSLSLARFLACFLFLSHLVSLYTLNRGTRPREKKKWKESNIVANYGP